MIPSSSSMLALPPSTVAQWLSDHRIFCGRSWGLDGNPDRAATEIESVLPRDIRESQRVSRCANKDCGFTIEDSAHPLFGRLAAARNDHGAETLSRFEGCPETDKWPKREGDVDSVRLADASAFGNLVPAVEPPIPTFFRIQPVNWFAGSPRCLMDADVLVDWICQIRTERRMLRLIINQLLLRRKRKLREIHATSKTPGVKRISRG